MKRICVFCGSNAGVDGTYAAAARALGSEIARRELGLVYGGGSVGLMGHVARAAKEAGATVTGVIPQGLLVREIGWEDAGDLRVVDTMHERKALMSELSDAFVVLPGGFGTLEEFFEVLTWSQLGIHDKPLGLLDVAGYYRPLISFFDHAQSEGFIVPQHRDLVVVESDPGVLLDRLESWDPPERPRWIDAGER
ncbi:MAG TPA: TIGR00730 family Rossman fold protein [Actinomycetota bacterium]|nr:TIGR00730 family Rossman fold protein [Actinomycetota bacterium]